MEKRMFAEKAPRDKVYRALAMLALLPSCVLAGCAGEKGVDAGSSSSAPYGGSETATSQPENSNTENPSQNKKRRFCGKNRYRKEFNVLFGERNPRRIYS